MSKLPGDVRLQIAWSLVGDVWEINELLGIIGKEMEARDKNSERKIKPPFRFLSKTSSIAAQGQHKN
mgnify:CR=1 FL=1